MRRTIRASYFVDGMHIIIGMPPHIIIMGAPIAIMALMASQRSFMRVIIDGSVGIIFIIMPSLVISQDIVHVIGAMLCIIIGIIIDMPFIMGIPPIIMPFIMGMPPIIMPFIMGIMPFIMGMPCMPPIMGIMPFIMGMLFMGMPCMPPIMGMLFMGMLFIGALIIGLAFIALSISSLRRSYVDPYGLAWFRR